MSWVTVVGDRKHRVLGDSSGRSEASGEWWTTGSTACLLGLSNGPVWTGTAHKVQCGVELSLSDSSC